MIESGYITASQNNSSTTYERCREYDQYLYEHTSSVRKSWYEILKPKIKNLIPASSIQKIEQAISIHDSSKYAPEEYVPYTKWYYGNPPKHPDNEYEYRKAWNHHQKYNKHHWQYWLIITDELEAEALDMDLEYIIEMLCDWHSFSSKDPESTAYNWYTKNQDKMVLSESTRELVERYVEFLRTPLLNK